MKYIALLNILDEICAEAPLDYKQYKALASDVDKLNKARSKAFIHLYLKVKFGLVDFKKRHALITDGPYDGGLDAYYIDPENKNLYLIQSKFRTSSKNFEEKSISASDLVRIELKRILKGEETDSNGKKFNPKVKKFQREWSAVRDQANYDFIVVILGNLKRYNDRQIRQLIDNSDYEIFDYERTYNELVFPVCCGTYYEPREITISINLLDKDQPILKQKITTKYGIYDVRILFVPTEEVGRILARYKNSMLQYNPRNYLTLSSNTVNQEIHHSIVATETNEFAILNNGITMLADYFTSTETTGRKGSGQVIIRNPQIINGGQTAYTLSEIFEDNETNKLFGNKEVLLKVVVIEQDNEEANVEFIEAISNATNQQTRVVEADRRSNDEIQLNIQDLLFDNFGYFYERKKGEFYPGTTDNYVKTDWIINRNRFIRSYLAWKGNATDARRSGEDKLFRIEQFKKILGDKENFSEMLFSYRVLEYLRNLGRRRKTQGWGYGIRYGKMAIISAVGILGCTESINLENIEDLVAMKVKEIKRKWISFEKWVEKQKHHDEYRADEGSVDFDNYYKGKTVNEDIIEFFHKS